MKRGISDDQAFAKIEKWDGTASQRFILTDGQVGLRRPPEAAAISAICLARRCVLVGGMWRGTVPKDYRIRGSVRRK